MNLFSKIACLALIFGATTLSAACPNGRCPGPVMPEQKGCGPQPCPRPSCCQPECPRCDQYECSPEYKRNYLMKLAEKDSQNRNQPASNQAAPAQGPQAPAQNPNMAPGMNPGGPAR